MTEQIDPETNSVYAVFAGGIELSAVQRIFQGITGASTAGVNDIHLLFQSFGGSVADGVCLYNFFRSLPISLTLYNVGSVTSAATTAYLGAQKRKVSAHATFMVHRVQSPGQPATAERLHAITQSVIADDERTEAIIRQHLTLTDDQWLIHRNADLWFTAKEAVACGLAEIGEFAPPAGSKIFNV